MKSDSVVVLSRRHIRAMGVHKGDLAASGREDRADRLFRRCIHQIKTKNRKRRLTARKAGDAAKSESVGICFMLALSELLFLSYWQAADCSELSRKAQIKEIQAFADPKRRITYTNTYSPIR